MQLHYTRVLLLALCTAAFPAVGSARAALAPMTFTPNPADLNDLDHHYSLSWRIDNINLNNISITSATLTFKNIANWDSNPNMLFVYLMDTATQSGINSL